MNGSASSARSGCPTTTLDRLAAWQRAHLRPCGAVVPRGNLHVTLAFLGARPAARRGRDRRRAARRRRGGRADRAATRARYRETRSVGMVVLADEGGAAAALAADLGARLERLGVYRPRAAGLAAARHRGAASASSRGCDPPLPELGRVSPSDAAVYSSVLRPGGAQYEVLEIGGR